MFDGSPIGRRDLVDLAPAVLLLVAGLVDVGTGAFGGSYPHSGWAHVPFVVLTTVPLVIRRRAPLLTLIAVAVPETVWLLLLFPVDQQPPFLPIVALVLAVYGAGCYTDGRATLAACCVLAVGIAADIPTLSAGKPLGDVVSPDVLLLLTFGVGRGFARLHRRAEVQAGELARAEQDREAAAASAAAAERARIARELHDVISHDVSMMVLQASVERRVRAGREGTGEPDTVDQTDQALANIESTGREALIELRRMLGVLRKDGADTPLRPQPGLAELPELVEQARAAGLRVRLVVEGEPVALPPGLSIAAYRIAQEALTNVAKHAFGAGTVTWVRYRDTALEIEVVDEGAPATAAAVAVPAGGGRGLVGMRERVAVLGGTLDAEHAPGGGFRVRARLPLPA